LLLHAIALGYKQIGEKIKLKLEVLTLGEKQHNAYNQFPKLAATLAASCNCFKVQMKRKRDMKQ
jgi:hypothetical protein